jgi:hypothetical protein
MPRLTLSYYDSDGQTRSFESDDPSVTIGSDPDCTLSIDNLQPVECEIYLADRGYYAKQLGQHITVNEVPGPGYLEDNDTLTLSEWLSLRVGVDEIPEPPTASKAPTSTQRPPQNSPTPGARHHASKTAVVLGVLLPGGGQAYNGQPIKGALFLLTTVLVLPWIWSLFDARSTANRLVAAGGRTGRGGPLWFILHGWFAINVALTVLVALTVAGVLR